MTDKQPSVFLEQMVYFFQGFRLILKMGEDGVADSRIESTTGKATFFDIGAEITDITFKVLRLGYFQHFLGKIEADKLPLASYLFQEERHEYTRAGTYIQYGSSGLNIKARRHGFQPGFVFFRRFIIPGSRSRIKQVFAQGASSPRGFFCQRFTFLLGEEITASIKITDEVITIVAPWGTLKR